MKARQGPICAWMRGEFPERIYSIEENPGTKFSLSAYLLEEPMISKIIDSYHLMGPSMGLNHAAASTSNLLGVTFGGKCVVHHGFSSIYILSLNNCDRSVDIYAHCPCWLVRWWRMCPTCGEGSCHSHLLQSGLLRKGVQLLVKPIYTFYLHHRNYAEVRGFRSSCFLFCDDDH